jgi:ATP-dependent protease HslVU (ClpYQ) peptidase subunit
MTCIVGVAHEGRVYIGGDSAGVGGYSLTVRADRKVFRNGDFVMGFTSSFRMGQLLHHAFNPPKRHPDTDIDKFMVTDFINAVRDCLKSGGYAEKHNDAERGGVFLVGYKGRLFRIDNDYQVGEAADGFDAVGCGEEIAQGAMYANKAGKPEQRLRMALEAAERFSAGVRGPFHFEHA